MKSEDDPERYFVDIDIDLENPLADLISIFDHQGDTTDHLQLRKEEYFMDQEGVRDELKKLDAEILNAGLATELGSRPEYYRSSF